MSCHGICVRYKASRGAGQPRYKLGSNRKRCTICEIFITTEDIRCPCCHYLLRTKPQNGNSKENKGMRPRVQEVILIKN